MLVQAQQGRDARAGRDGVADGPRSRVPLDSRLQTLEARRPRREVRVHVLQGVDGRALDDVEHGVAQKRAPESPRARELRHDGAAHGVADEYDGWHLGPLHLPARESDGGEEVVGECLEAQVERLPLGNGGRAVAPGVEGEDAGGRQTLADLVPYNGEREARGSAAVMHHKEGALADGGGEVGVDSWTLRRRPVM